MLTVDYDFYCGVFHGKMPREDFERLSVYAAAYLDAYLLNEQGGGIASETNDGVSVTYVAGISNSKTEGRRLYEAAALFLGPTGLLYRGVR